MLDPRAELIAAYQEAKAAGNNKGAMDILLKIAKIDAQTKTEPTAPPPDSFPTRRAAREYLDECGWSGVYSTFCLHVEQRKIIPAPDGSFLRDDLDAYAVRELVHHAQNAAPNNLDEINAELKREELLKAQRRRAKEEGELVSAAAIRREWENMLVSFRSRVLLVPRKLSSQLAQMGDVHQVEALLNREMRDCLTTLAQFTVDSSPGVAD